MVTILFTIMLSGIQYNVSTTNCKEMGGTLYPVDDRKEARVLIICDVEPLQNLHIADHELIHMCMHNHKHMYKTKQELDEHLQQQEYTEEQLTVTLAPCLVENQDKLFKALVKHGIRIPQYGGNN